ncbi:helix-turn-helix domain-containing protein [Acrocarpospora macrocephala]|uniref:Fis family transcriptional regulator n=1 Tax=Acrocarpospora macrocephala TaxID=150177 RepID=A0A5M3WE30_9ACTN|nr:helix-turn-helix domain-containing protein [Acrocarpospora macrocephala]GES07204.1 Fis family transcriptional regulator [Acrocarpospora macrocephala]
MTPSPSGQPLILRSWERSRMCGLDRGDSLTLPYQADFEASGRFLRAAEPVMDRLAEWLPGCGTSAVLTDAAGQLLLIRCDDDELSRRLEAGQSAPGFVWSEEFSGTNAVGIALEERIATWTTGNDHYLEVLRDLACAAVPIVNPLTQRLEGAVDLTTLLHRASPLMMPMAMQAAKAIEDRLVELGSAAERCLLEAFMSATKRPGRSVVVLSDRAEFSSAAASKLLGADDRALLGQRAEDLGDGAERRPEEVPLSNGEVALARFEQIRLAGRRIGTLVQLTIPASSSRRSPGTVVTGRFGGPKEFGFLGRSPAAKHVNQRIQEVGSSTFPLVIDGEAGAGKFTVAKLIARRTGKPVVFDVSNTPSVNEANLLRELGDVLSAGSRCVIVKGIGDRSEEFNSHLATLAETAENHASRVIATLTSGSAARVAKAAGFGVRLTVPSLRERPEDILDLAPALISRRGARVRIAPPVLHALMRYEWPGNVRELDSVLSAMLNRSRGSEITLSDLPAHYQRGSRRLRRIEHIERSAIIQAITEAGGNKTQAAELLEIGRATLYRKMKAYKLDPDLLGG